MIGMVNVPCDSPMDFYATPKRNDSIQRSRAGSDTSPVPRTSKRTPSYRPLFTDHKKHIEYSEDGRKISDGKVLEQNEPNKLWEELLLRSFAQRIETEIQSPVESYKTLDFQLGQLNVKDPSLYRSTYSLVSANRVENPVEIAHLNSLDDTHTHDKKKRSHSTGRMTAILMAPFIKSIKGKKKKPAKE